MNKVEKTYRDFAAAAKADPSVLARVEAMEALQPEGEGGLPSIDAAAKRMDAIPELANAAKGAGVETREVVIFSYVLAGTAMASAMAQGKDVPPSASAPALAENVRWYREHEAEVTRFLQQMNSLYPDEKKAARSAEEWSVEVQEGEAAEGAKDVEETEAESDSTTAPGE